jgi:NAD+ synthase
MAEHLGIPREICERPPTSDTYSAPCDQEEFFFRLPFETMDVLWFSQEHQLPVEEVAEATGLSEVQVRRAFADFTRKHRTTEYLRMPPLSIQ